MKLRLHFAFQLHVTTQKSNDSRESQNDFIWHKIKQSMNEVTERWIFSFNTISKDSRCTGWTILFHITLIFKHLDFQDCQILFISTVGYNDNEFTLYVQVISLSSITN